jgi:SAM-dependent methyltransferase
VGAPLQSDVDALREELAPLSWAERFERLHVLRTTVPPDERPVVRQVRVELAEIALAELTAEWKGLPLKEGIRRLASKKMRTALASAAMHARDEHIVEMTSTRGALLGDAGEHQRFGVGMDERIVEIPLALHSARLHEPGRILDAGASLNLPVVRRIAGRPAAHLTHFTLTGVDEPVLPGHEDQFAYAYGDLRAMPYPDAAFDRVVSVSTIEHVGMDNARYGGSTEHAPSSAVTAVAELTRVLAPGGELLITVPYGRAADHGWFRVFDAEALGTLLAPASGDEVSLRYFYYDGGWAENGSMPPARVLEAGFAPDVVTGVAVVRVIKNGGDL